MHSSVRNICVPRRSVAALLLVFFGASSLAAEEGFAEGLAGCWEQTDGETREHWVNTGHGLLFGYSITVRDGALITFEDLRIEQNGSTLVFVASPGGAPAVRFPSTRVTRREAVFENAEHDFPQRIGYRIAGDGLIASISSLDDTKNRAFVMHRCID